MTPEEQMSQSVKYVCTQFCAVPLEDGRFGLFVSYGAHRTYQGTFSPEELSEWLRKDFAKRKTLNAEKLAHEERIRRQKQNKPLHDPLANLSIDVKL